MYVEAFLYVNITYVLPDRSFIAITYVFKIIACLLHVYLNEIESSSILNAILNGHSNTFYGNGFILMR